MPNSGTRSSERPGAKAGLCAGRADRAREHVGLVGRDLPVADRDVQQRAVGRRAGGRVGGDVVRPAVALAAVPQHVDQPEDQRALGLARVGRVEDRAVGLPVRGAAQQHGEVDPGHAEDRALEVGRHRGQRGAEDAALAVAVVVQARRVDEPLERRVRGQALRVDQQPPQVHLVEEALLVAVGERGEAREVAEQLDRVRDVLGGHAAPRRRAEREVVLGGHVADVRPRRPRRGRRAGRGRRARHAPGAASAAFGISHSNFAVCVLPGRWAGSASFPPLA